MTLIQKNFYIGLAFSIIATLFWGVLAIALKLSTEFTDSVTLTWVRFVVALTITLVIQGLSGHLKQYQNLNLKDWSKLLFASLFLIINYNSFVISLDYIPPGSAQLNFQIAPFFLAIGGVIFLGDRIKLIQWLCFVTLAIGMLLFFHPYINIQPKENASILVGVALIQLSAMSWSIYALLQKSLSRKISPSNILLVIYLLGSIIMFPMTNLSPLSSISTENWWVIAFCSLNTLIAYGSFAQAMKYWETVQVSAMVALTPLATFAATTLCVYMSWWPNLIQNENIDYLSFIGMFIVLSSAVVVQLVSRPTKKQ